MKASFLTPLLVGPALFLGTAIASAGVPSGTVADAAALTGVRDLGRAPATRRIDVAVVLSYRHEAELERLVDAQSDPDSPIFRHFLSNKQFADAFAPTEGDYARAVAALRAAGLTVTRTYGNRTVVDAAGTAAAVERAFSTQIHALAQPGYGSRYGNVTPATAPAGIRDLVAGVVGLSNVINEHVDNRRGTPMHPATLTNLFGPDGGYGPIAFIDTYDMPVKSGADGSGHGNGVVIDSDFADTDLATFLTQFGITRTGPATNRVNVDGGPGTGDELEATLDVETIVSLSPGTALSVYEIPQLADSNILDAYNQVVTDNVVDAVNSSFSGCETKQIAAAKADNHVALQGASKGITFHASTGDGGSIAFACSTTSVGTPASTPHFSAIGGTQLLLDPNTGKVVKERAWADNGSSSGGVSVVFGLPKWQANVANVIPTGRNEPDVSFDASPGSGESLYLSSFGGWVGPIGGTSLSSPIFGAMISQINEVSGTRAGFVNPFIYKQFRKHGYGKLFRDMLDGNNGFYNAGPGYDQVTGIGTFDAALLAAHK